MSKPRLMIVVGSVRQGRVGLPVAQWFLGKAQAHGGFVVDFVDLKELGLPFMDEPNHPRLRQYTHDYTHAWSERVDAADCFVFVTPEYNHSTSPPLKNAVDYLHDEWAGKPVGFVTYGGLSGGGLAGASLGQLALAVSMVPLTMKGVRIPMVHEHVADGRFVPTDLVDTSGKVLLGALEHAATALRPLRPEAH